MEEINFKIIFKASNDHHCIQAILCVKVCVRKVAWLNCTAILFISVSKSDPFEDIVHFFLTSSRKGCMMRLCDTTKDNPIVLLQSQHSLGSNSGNLTQKLHFSILQYTIGSSYSIIKNYWLHTWYIIVMIFGILVYYFGLWSLPLLNPRWGMWK